VFKYIWDANSNHQEKHTNFTLTFLLIGPPKNYEVWIQTNKYQTQRKIAL